MKVWLCKPMNYTVHGILQARILEWVAFPFSTGSSQPRDWTQVSHIAGSLFTTWATREAQEYWSGQPIPSPADLPDPGIKPGSPSYIAGGFFNWAIWQALKKALNPFMVKSEAHDKQKTFCKKECLIVLNFPPSPSNLSHPGIKPGSPAWLVVLTIWVTREAFKFGKGSS